MSCCYLVASRHMRLSATALSELIPTFYLARLELASIQSKEDGQTTLAVGKMLVLELTPAFSASRL